jgi:hypothetical protein
VSCRGKALHALRECGCFKRADFAALLESEQQWFALLDTLRHLR